MKNSRNAILLHGTGDSPESFWLPFIKKELEAKGYSVFSPQLPEADCPHLKVQLPYILKHAIFTPQTVIIAHSAGCPLALAVLEKIDCKIKQLILVAGFVQPLGKLENFKPILKESYNWEKMKKNVEEFITIHSDNDPWGCDDKQGQYLIKHLGGTLIIRQGEGHMGSETYNQPYKEFPFLARLIS